MVENERDVILTQLRHIRGHINGIENMVNEGKDCPEVLVQVAAVSGSMKKLELMITKHMADQCIEKALAEGRDLRQEMDKILSNIFKYR